MCTVLLSMDNKKTCTIRDQTSQKELVFIRNIIWDQDTYDVPQLNFYCYGCVTRLSAVNRFGTLNAPIHIHPCFFLFCLNKKRYLKQINMFKSLMTTSTSFSSPDAFTNHPCKVIKRCLNYIKCNVQ
jgi:hypothetical protein